MDLANDFTVLRNRVFADLIRAHDYHADTMIAWDLVREVIASGRKIAVRSEVTGTMTRDIDLDAKSEGYIDEQLSEATFQQFIAIFENFYFEFLGLWLTAYPRSLGKKMVDFQTILDLPDKEAITQLVVRKELNDVLYDRPAGWFAYLEEKVKLGCPSAGEVERIAEIKATRDVLAHNQGIVNKIHGAKAGVLARFPEGSRIEISERYHRESWELIHKVASDLSDAAIAKLA